MLRKARVSDIEAILEVIRPFVEADIITNKFVNNFRVINIALINHQVFASQ